MVSRILTGMAEAERERNLEQTNEGRIGCIGSIGSRKKFGKKVHVRISAALLLISQGETLSSVAG